MSKRLHNGYWLASLVVLTLLTAWVYLIDDERGKDYDEFKFTLEVNSIITSVNIYSTSDTLSFEYLDGAWIVNNDFQMDPGMRDAFFTVVSSIRIKRPVSNQVRDSIQQHVRTMGRRVKILNQGEVIKSYWVSGDEISGVSYFMDENDQVPYEVVLPGYDSYVAGIYSVPLIDWRNRFIFELDWSNLKSIIVNYDDARNGFEVTYKEDFFYLYDQIEPVDSAVMFDYIGELRNLQAQKYFKPGENSTYDSLVNTPIKAKVMIEVIGDPVQWLEVFETIPGERWIIARHHSGLLVQFDPRALRPILVQYSDWE